MGHQYNFYFYRAPIFIVATMFIAIATRLVATKFIAIKKVIEETLIAS